MYGSKPMSVRLNISGVTKAKIIFEERLNKSVAFGFRGQTLKKIKTILLEKFFLNHLFLHSLRLQGSVQKQALTNMHVHL